MNKLGYVYFLTNERESAVKVGFTVHDPKQRLAQLQTGNHEVLELIGSFRGTMIDEKSIHEKWRWVKAKGGTEWFNVNRCAALDMIQFMNSRYTRIDSPSYIKKNVSIFDEITLEGEDNESQQ